MLSFSFPSPFARVAQASSGRGPWEKSGLESGNLAQGKAFVAGQRGLGELGATPGPPAGRDGILGARLGSGCAAPRAGHGSCAGSRAQSCPGTPQLQGGQGSSEPESKKNEIRKSNDNDTSAKLMMASRHREQDATHLCFVFHKG